MVDQSSRAYVRIREHHHTLRRCTQQADKLESKLARTYTDDAVARLSVMPSYRDHVRPGQRDDEVLCNFAVTIPNL